MPRVQVAFHRLADRELAKACARYAREGEGLRLRFIAAVDAATERIAEAPLQWATYADKYRWIRVGKFAYVLYYQIISESCVLVLAVAHTSRRPGYWHRRHPES